MAITIGSRPDHGFDEPLGLLSDCHRRIEHFLRVLVAIDERAAARPLTDAERAELQAALTYFATAAPRHTADEEDSLFPRLRESSDPDASRALEQITRLERDHDEADAHHRVVDGLGRQWLADGSLVPRAALELRAHLTALERIYERHIAVEDRELFPAAARVLSASGLREIGREMRARRSIRPMQTDDATRSA
jgi:hemerythrin-like domain-containing protein